MCYLGITCTTELVMKGLLLIVSSLGKRAGKKLGLILSMKSLLVHFALSSVIKVFSDLIHRQDKRFWAFASLKPVQLQSGSLVPSVILGILPGMCLLYPPTLSAEVS